MSRGATNLDVSPKRSGQGQDPGGASPIIVLGAGRSGTKMLRSLLVASPDMVCFPKEINYIWRHGNRSFATDELPPDLARPEVARYIRRRFDRFARAHGGRRVVEKTCASTLRVDFVRAVFPHAVFVHLVRDGRAVAESAMRRWQTPNPVRYLIQKARWVPPLDVPYYAWRYLTYRLRRNRDTTSAYQSWGPRFEGMDAAVRTRSLVEVCGLQWLACVRATSEAVSRLPPSQAVTIRYEDLVANPLEVGERLYDRLDMPFHPQSRDFARAEIHTGNLEKWQQRLSAEDMDKLLPLIGDELAGLGYLE